MKALGVLIIALGLMMMIIGVKGTQHEVLSQIKTISPALRKATNTQPGPGQVTTVPKTTGPNPPPVQAV